MKKLTLTLVMLAAGMTFAHAQSTDSAKTATDSSVNAMVQTDALIMTPAETATTVDTMKAEEAEVLKAEDTAVKSEKPLDEKQKAKMEKKAKAKAKEMNAE
ncbi:MAG: hypothetical protein ACOH1X_10400 [Kaistella sp.]